MLEFILLQAAGKGGAYTQLIMFAAIFVVFYFFMIRPQQKKTKDQAKFRDELKRGDAVVTVGGLHGKIADIEGDIVVIEVDRTTRLRFDKSAISAESTKRVQAVKSE